MSTSTSCDAGTVQVNYTFHGHEGLRWFTVYLDGETVRGGPVSGTEHSGSWAGDAASGEHDIEVVVEDTADGRAVSRKLVICP